GCCTPTRGRPRWSAPRPPCRRTTFTAKCTVPPALRSTCTAVARSRTGCSSSTSATGRDAKWSSRRSVSSCWPSPPKTAGPWSELLNPGVLGRQRLRQVRAQRACGVVGRDRLGRDADTGLGFDAGAQLQVAQRVQPVVGERPVRVDRATQDQAGLLGDQLAQPGGPLVGRQLMQFGTQRGTFGPVVIPGALERFGERAAG